jgi:hypothetical protein
MPEADYGGEPLYAIPAGEPIELELMPRKTSWDAASATSQVELSRYLDHVAELTAPRMRELAGDLALRLDVGLPAEVDPLFEHDLDNFLHPVIKHLGGGRFVTAWATKAPGDRSYLRIEPARRVRPEPGWQRWPGRTSVSTARERDWKDQVKAALANATEEPPGPVSVQLSLTVSPERSWPNLWKMVIDALDPILGRSFPDDAYDPRDGRIVRLGLHAREDASVGLDVPFAIRARPADLRWPEIAWFAAMSESERAAWLAEHERRCATNRRSRRGARPRVAPSVEPAQRGPAPATARVIAASSVPSTRGGRAPALAAAGGIGEIRSVEEFRAAVRGGKLLVITDSAQPAKLHPAAARCSGVTEHNFVGKVIERGGRGGKYFTVSGADVGYSEG